MEQVGDYDTVGFRTSDVVSSAIVGRAIDGGTAVNKDTLNSSINSSTAISSTNIIGGSKKLDKYGVLNYTYGTNGIKVPNGENYLVNLWDVNNNYEGYKENVSNDIKKLRDKVDVLIVAMHWGIEYINNTLVFYSLGNFISSQTSDSCTNYKCNIGLLSSLKITKTTDGIKIDNVMNELIYTYNNNHSDYLVIPFSNEKITEYLPNYQEVYNNYANIINSDDERIKTVPLAS